MPKRFGSAGLFVDSRVTAIGHIGEIQIPLDRGAISEKGIIADFHGLSAGNYTCLSDDEITIAKNGSGAHLDLMTADDILAAVG